MLNPGDSVRVDTPSNPVFDQLMGKVLKRDDDLGVAPLILVDLGSVAGSAWFAERELKRM